MDAGTYLKRPWEDDERNLQSTGSIMPGPIVMPGITSTTTYQLASSTAALSPNDRILPSLSTTLDRQPQSPIDHRYYSTFPKNSRPSQLPPRAYSPPGGPLKRPRLLYYPNHGPEHLHPAVRDSPPNSHTEIDGSSSRNPEPLPHLHGQDEIGAARFQSCSNCSDLKELVHNVISGLVGLDSEVRQAMSGAIFGQSTKQETEPPLHISDVGELGLRGSLVWAANSIEYSTRLVRDFAISRPLPQMAINTPGLTHPDQSSINPTTSETLKRRLDLSERDRYEDNKKYCPPSTFEDLSRTSEASIPNMAGEGPRRGYGGSDPAHTVPGHSPHRTLSSSGSVVFGPSQSPMQAPPSSRMLPSPSSMHFPSSASGFPPMPSPPGTSQSAHAAHLQDLQHQISTKTLALQTLQREHDNLLAAFSRQQTRCATLDKKSQVSDNEINSLTEEKIRLQSLVEALEAQVEDLIKSRDEAHKQSVANGAQYMQIMSMSSRLQAQGAADTKRWKTEKEEWEKERDGLKDRIQKLEIASPTRTIGSAPFCDGSEHPALSSLEQGSSGEIATDSILSSTSLEVLRSEIVRLRKACHDMELTLQDLKSEASRIDQVMRDFGSIGKRISTKAERGIQQSGGGQQSGAVPDDEASD